MFVLREGLSVERIDDECVIFDPDDSAAYHLSQTANKILEWAIEGKSVNQMVHEAQTQYDVTLDQARADIEHFLHELIEGRILDERCENAKH